MSSQSNDIFLVMFVGQLEYVHFPDAHDILIKFKFVYGSDFVVTTGMQEGITQTASRVGWDALSPLHLNFPIEITLKSTNPFGWPKLLLCAYGRDFFGREILRGYGAMHMPAAAGRHSLRIPLFKPQPSTTLGSIANWLSGRTPEFIDPSIVARSKGREVVRTSSSGFVHVDISVVTKGLTQLGYACSARESRPVSIASYNLPFSLQNNAAISSKSGNPARLFSSESSASEQNVGETSRPYSGTGGQSRAATISKTDAVLLPRRSSGPIQEEVLSEQNAEEDDEESEESDEEAEDEQASNSDVSRPSTAAVPPPQPTPRRRSSNTIIAVPDTETPSIGQINDSFERSPTKQTQLSKDTQLAYARSSREQINQREDSSGGSRRSSDKNRQQQHTVQIETHERERSYRQ